MPPKKKQKSTLQAELDQFVSQAVTEFHREAKGDTISKKQLVKVCKNLDLQYDATLLDENEGEEEITEEYFKEAIRKLKMEADLSRLFDYAFEYLSSNRDSITIESFFKALKTLPKQPKMSSTIADMFRFATESASMKKPLTKPQFKQVCRRVGFFEKHYKPENVNSSFQ